MGKSIFSQNLVKARKKKGWSQEKTARKMKTVERARYAAWEEGRSNPPMDLMPVIMEAFGIKENDMYPFVFNENFFRK